MNNISVGMRKKLDELRNIARSYNMFNHRKRKTTTV